MSQDNVTITTTTSAAPQGGQGSSATNTPAATLGGPAAGNSWCVCARVGRLACFFARALCARVCMYVCLYVCVLACLRVCKSSRMWCFRCVYPCGSTVFGRTLPLLTRTPQSNISLSFPHPYAHHSVYSRWTERSSCDVPVAQLKTRTHTNIRIHARTHAQNQ